jgi:hypothetical protein
MLQWMATSQPPSLTMIGILLGQIAIQELCKQFTVSST